MNKQATAIQQGKRFEFGKNWQRFLGVVGDQRIAEAEKSLCEMLELESLRGKSLLDVGSGSGLFSLAAVRLGAEKVYSFDVDPASVACTRELKQRFLPDSQCWTISEGSVLDRAFLESLDRFDIVYSWGVLHHTGNMWQAMESVVPLVAGGGRLLIAIYNDQGRTSQRWKTVKRLYNSGLGWRVLIVSFFFSVFVAAGAREDLVRLKNPFNRYREYKKTRGMSVVHDWFDWLGGYPFEVAKPEEVFDFYRKRGFTLLRLKTCGAGLGNNQFVFMKNAG